MPIKSILRAIGGLFWDRGPYLNLFSQPAPKPPRTEIPPSPNDPQLPLPFPPAHRDPDEVTKGPYDWGHVPPLPGDESELRAHIRAQIERSTFGKRKVPPPPPVYPGKVPNSHVMRLCSPDDIALLEQAWAIRHRGGRPVVTDANSGKFPY